MVEHLFTSKTRVEILKLFLLDNNIEFHLREIARRIDAEPNAVKRELDNLKSVGVIKSKKDLQRNLFSLADFPQYKPLRDIFWLDYMICGDIISENILQNIQKLIITKNYLLNVKSLNKDAPNEIDIVLIGHVDINALEEFMQKMERKYERTLNYTIMGIDEWNMKLIRREIQIMGWLISDHIELNIN